MSILSMKFPLAQSLPELFSRKSLTLSQFDNMITVHAGGTSPPLPFKNVHHYYTHAASHRVLGDVSIPFLGINLDDDPMEKNVPMYETDNERVVLVVTCGGGNLGWLGTDVTVLGGCPSCPPPDIQTKSRDVTVKGAQREVEIALTITLVYEIPSRKFYVFFFIKISLLLSIDLGTI